MRAAALFGAISAENDVREAWLGLATARRRLGDAAGAAAALAEALRRHVPDPGFAALADAIAREAGAAGWCGLSGDGALTVRPTGRPAPSPRPPPARGGGGFGSPRATAAISWAARSTWRRSPRPSAVCAQGWRPDGLGLAPGGSQRRSGTDDPSGERTRTDHDHRIRHRRTDRSTAACWDGLAASPCRGCVARAERIAACAGS